MDCSCDTIMPDLYKETWRKARKTHECCECSSPIDPGEKYMEIAGIWDGEWARFVMCEMCYEIRSENEQYAECMPFGEMWDFLGG